MTKRVLHENDVGLRAHGAFPCRVRSDIVRGAEQLRMGITDVATYQPAAPKVCEYRLTRQAVVHAPDNWRRSLEKRAHTHEARKATWIAALTASPLPAILAIEGSHFLAGSNRQQRRDLVPYGVPPRRAA
jgi:hypothetical protein